MASFCSLSPSTQDHVIDFLLNLLSIHDAIGEDVYAKWKWQARWKQLKPMFSSRKALLIHMLSETNASLDAIVSVMNSSGYEEKAKLFSSFFY